VPICNARFRSQQGYLASGDYFSAWMSNPSFSIVEPSFEHDKLADGSTLRDLSTVRLSELEEIFQAETLPTIQPEKLSAVDLIAPDLKSDVVEKRPIFPDLKAKVESIYERTFEPLKVMLHLVFPLTHSPGFFCELQLCYERRVRVVVLPSNGFPPIKSLSFIW
jgi:hypothetical protein